MAASVYYFACREDHLALWSVIESVGLTVIPVLVQAPLPSRRDDPASGWLVYLSPVPREALHPYGQPPGYGPATDPIIELLQGYDKGSYLVMGRVYWSDDVPEFGKVTLPYFRKIRSWIRANWEKLPDGQYIGPAAKLAASNGVELKTFPPGVPIERRYIG